MYSHNRLNFDPGNMNESITTAKNFCNFNNFRMLFLAVVKDLFTMPGAKFGPSWELSISIDYCFHCYNQPFTKHARICW